MKIETKFELGQIVYIVSSMIYQTTKICDTCEGIGSLYSKNGKKTHCHRCWGKGEIEITINQPFTVDNNPVKINRIKVEVGDYQPLPITEVCYGIHDTVLDIVNEKYVFATKKEAIAECNRLNNEF